MSATHFIHIGRNKCASTTLQYFFLQNAALLAAHGIDHFADSKVLEKFPKLPDVRKDSEHRDYLRAHPERSTLLSNEWLMALPPEFTDAQIAALDGAPCRVIAYIREYDAWMRSNYVESVSSGETWADFDAFYAQTLPTASALPALTHWGQSVGWYNMQLRALDPDTLYRGDVLADCVRALGLPDDVTEAAKRENKNEAPHWISVELIRAARNLCADMEGALFRRTIKRPLLQVFEDAARAHAGEIPNAYYLTSEQSLHLSTLYDHDARMLSAVLDQAIVPVTSTAPERPFLPSIAAIPRAVLDHVAQHVSAPDFAAQHPAAKAVIDTLHTTGGRTP